MDSATSLLVNYGIQAAMVVGLTAVARKIIPKEAHAFSLPIAAMVIGTAIVAAPIYLPEGTFEIIAQGVALGGTATGLYAIRSDAKKP